MGKWKKGHIETSFRESSICCSFLSEAFLFQGKQYLQQILSKPILDLIRCKENLETNEKILKKWTSVFADAIFSSTASFPSPLRRICQYVFEQMMERAEERDAINALSTIVFLRFINVAIVTPHHFGIAMEETIPITATKNLVKIAKTLQRMTFNTSEKDGDMDICQTYSNRLKEFLCDIQKNSAQAIPQLIPTDDSLAIHYDNIKKCFNVQNAL